MRSHILNISMALRMWCQRAFRAREASGEAPCHPLRGNGQAWLTHIKHKRRMAFATVTPGVTVHAAVTSA